METAVAGAVAGVSAGLISVSTGLWSAGCVQCGGVSWTWLQAASTKGRSGGMDRGQPNAVAACRTTHHADTLSLTG